ncbi:Uncharacterised protein [uncultured archaeon]|nr:Uncharacterised protein [uncultured archaeon]
MIENEKTDGFKFALTALTAIGTLLYATYSYSQKTAIDIKYYVPFIGLISVSLILLIFLLFYIFIKGYSLELHRPKDSDLKKRNEILASAIYLLAFLIFIMLLTNVILLFAFGALGKLDNNAYYIIFILSILSSFLFGWPYLEYKQDNEKLNILLNHYITHQKILNNYIINFLNGISKQKLEKLYLMFKGTFGEKNQKKLKEFNLIFINILKNDSGKEIPQNILKFYFAFFLLGTASLIWLIIVFLLILNFPLLGHVTFDMQSIYYKNDEQIPIQITITGPIYDSQLRLYKEISESNLTLIDRLSLKPGHNSSRKISGEQSILSGNAFELGTYYSFINITNPNMTPGYYELIYSVSNYEYGKSFYLLNKSEISQINR